MDTPQQPKPFYQFPQQPDFAPVEEGWYVNRVRYVYKPAYPEIELEEGFRTDIMSSPRPLWWLFPPDDLHRAAAGVHDKLYQCEGRMVLADGTIWQYTRADADDILLEIMLRLNIPMWKCYAAWLAVRLFGGSHWAAK